MPGMAVLSMTGAMVKHCSFRCDVCILLIQRKSKKSSMRGFPCVAGRKRKARFLFKSDGDGGYEERDKDNGT